MRRFLILATAVLAGGLLTPACGDDPTGPESVAGLYILQTVNGVALPVDFGADNLLRAGWIQLNSDGTYTASLTTESFGELKDIGTFAVVGGSTVDFMHSGGFLEDRFTGTISGNTLTTRISGDTFVYRIGPGNSS